LAGTGSPGIRQNGVGCGVARRGVYVGKGTGVGRTGKEGSGCGVGALARTVAGVGIRFGKAVRVFVTEAVDTSGLTAGPWV
jgi:hypothetical protein